MLLDQEKTAKLLGKYGISLPRQKLVSSPDEIKHFPAAIKVVSPQLVHKSETGLVFLDVKNKQEAHEKFAVAKAYLAKHRIDQYSFLVQEMVKGVELIVGMKKDAVFGPVIVFGVGGILVEIVHDVSMRIAPLTKKDCRAMLDEIQAKKILDGYRSLPKVNKEKIIDLLMKTSKLAMKETDIYEIDFNPVMADEKRAVVVDARVLY